MMDCIKITIYFNLKAYYQNMKPADFGTNFQTTYDTMNSMADRNRKKVNKIIFEQYFKNFNSYIEFFLGSSFKQWPR
jgi:hypothetical protein